MKGELEHIDFFPVWNYNYSDLFRTVPYNGKTLNNQEREETIKVIDEEVSLYQSGLPLFAKQIEYSEGKTDDYNYLDHIISSVMLYVIMIKADCMVAAKYFLFANTDYDKRYMRGKLKILLNEGFKRLYGFNEKNKNTSEWNKLLEILNCYSNDINIQYQDLTALLENHSRKSTWWKDERDIETHLDAEKLYFLRQVDLDESRVMMETLQLFNAVHAVSLFVGNLHACLVNKLVDLYKRGKLKGQ